MTTQFKFAADWGFTEYRTFRPTGFDCHIELDDKEHWAVMPVTQTRDSPVIDKVNFTSFLEGLGGEGETVEVHRFGHWGPGWFEIIIVNPEDHKAMQAAYEMAGALQDYPILDEEALGAAEHEEAQECWDNWGRSDVERKLVGLIESMEDSTIEDADEEASQWLDAWVEENGLPNYESTNEGARFNVEDIAYRVFNRIRRKWNDPT